MSGDDGLWPLANEVADRMVGYVQGGKYLTVERNRSDVGTVLKILGYNGRVGGMYNFIGMVNAAIIKKYGMR